MSAQMHILGWKVSGLRCPDHEIDLRKGPGETPHRISLIQMPNGTGKTTTLALLRAALSGTAKHWPREKVLSYSKSDNDDPYGHFELTLLLGGRRVTIRMEFDFELGTVGYKTTRDEGQVPDFRLPVPFNRFHNSPFVNFFVFNGELANELLDSKKTRAEVAIEHLFQLGLFHQMRESVQEYWKEQAPESDKKPETLVRRQRRVERLTERLNSLLKLQSELDERKQETTQLLQDYRNTYDDSLRQHSSLAEQYQTYQDDAASLESTLRLEALTTLEMARNPAALAPTFATGLADLKDALDRVKLPASAAREFFEELAEENLCICGRPISVEHRTAIRERAEQYLGSENMQLLNQMKGNIAATLGTTGAGPTDSFEQQLAVVRDVQSGHRQALQVLQQIKTSIESTDPETKRVKTLIDEAEAKLREIEDQLAKFDSTDDALGDDHTFGIEVIRHRLQNAEIMLDKMRETVGLQSKRDILIDILDRAYNISRENILDRIRIHTNERIRELMPHNRIEIAGIDRSLKLRHQERGSEGENLSVAYAFLSTLFTGSQQRLPFVVDSPAIPIDLDIRPEIARLVPKLSHQFIAFTISSERQGFVRPLERGTEAPDQIQYVTLFRKRPGALEGEARASKQYAESADGIWTTSKEFFYRFQIDEEDGD